MEKLNGGASMRWLVFLNGDYFATEYLQQCKQNENIT